MKKLDFYREIEKGALEGACRYFEYWFIYDQTPENTRVLELGAGTSTLGITLQKKGCRVMATDIDKKAIAFQKSHGVEVTVPEKCKLDYKNESFDVVIAASSLEHFDDIQTTIEEVRRVLVPGGLFIIAIPTGSKFIKNIYKGKKHPQMMIFDKKSYEKLFLDRFTEVERKFYKVTGEKPKDYTPHSGWGNRVNFKEADDFGDDVGLCAVLVS